jgi:predicted GNAT family N-acyltransferase
MFITRATRHDKSDLDEFYRAHDWEDAIADDGVAFLARDGAIVGAARLIQLAPDVLMVNHVLVANGRRGQGIGESIMKAAMNSRGGKLFLSCHEERIPFYERLGFRVLPADECPDEAVAYWKKVGDIPWTEDHVHYFMTAR